MTDPLVSVIIPTYNRSEYVQVAIESVLHQNYQNYEIIIIDDGSTDDTGRIVCEKYGDRIQYYSQENQGESAARNRGISLAKGEYIACLDSDDYWQRDKLLFQVRAIEKSNKTRVAVVCSAVWVVDAQGKKIHSEPVGRLGKLNKNISLRSLFFGPKIFSPPSNMLIRSNCLREINGFDPRIRFGEDWDLIIRLRAKWDFVYIDQPLLYYRVHTFNQQNTLVEEAKIPMILADHLEVIQKNAQRLGWQDASFVRAAKVQEYEKAAYWSLARERWAQGMELLMQATEINQKPISTRRLASSIGYWGAIRASDCGYSVQAAEQYLFSTLLPALEEHWNSSLGKFPAKGISGWYYHNLAFQSAFDDKECVAKLCRKSVVYERRLLVSPSTLKVILQDFLHHGFGN